MKEDPFKKYIKETEPGKREKGYAWHTAIGLQAVDGLKTSEYLTATALRNIEGEITFEEADSLLHAYYEEKPTKDKDDRTEEADKVSVRIAALLSENAFSFTPQAYLSIHKRLFTGIYSHAGQIRDYNITKKEWVLDGDTVMYGSATELRATLEYDLSEERRFSYRNLTMDETIRHLAFFVSRLWQIHVFCEGNTRTTAVFFIKYLRSLGFKATNDIFAENAWYFRNSLVRANYNDLGRGIHETTEYLEMFLRNLLLGEHHPLHNRSMHVSGAFQDHQKANIGTQKVNIGKEKANIESGHSVKTANHIQKMRAAFADQTVFGRSDVMKVTGVQATRASELLKMLTQSGIIEPVRGHGKGKYRFSGLLKTKNDTNMDE